MQRLIPFDTLFRPNTIQSGSYHGVARGIYASLSPRQKRTIVFSSAGPLWGLPFGPTVAGETATAAGQEVSPASVAARLPDVSTVPSDVAVPEPWNLHGQLTFVKQIPRLGDGDVARHRGDV